MGLGFISLNFNNEFTLKHPYFILCNTGTVQLCEVLAADIPQTLVEDAIKYEINEIRLRGPRQVCDHYKDAIKKYQASHYVSSDIDVIIMED